MAPRRWKHGPKIPDDFVRCDDRDRIRACEAARVRIVWSSSASGAIAFLPEWAARAPEGTPASLLRRGRRDPEVRAALLAAGRIAPLQPKLTNTWLVQAAEAERLMARVVETGEAVVTAQQGALGIPPGTFMPPVAARPWGRR